MPPSGIEFITGRLRRCIERVHSRYARIHTQEFHSRAPRKGDFGASYLEFAIVVPILLLATLGAIDFMRYMSMQARLTSAAQAALTQAQLIPGLEQAAPATGENAFTKARRKVADGARAYVAQVVGAGFKLEAVPLSDEEIVSVPPLDPGQESRDSAFARVPIAITLQGELKPFLFPLTSLRLTGKAAGFRESRQVVSNPIPLDCSGRPFIPGQPISGCSCGDFGSPNPRTGLCRCDPCPGGSHPVPGSPTCECDCGEERLFTTVGPNRQCVCDLNKKSCPGELAPYTDDNQLCQCGCVVKGRQNRQGDRCCPNDTQILPGGSVCCPFSTNKEVNGQCVCASPPGNCIDGEQSCCQGTQRWRASECRCVDCSATACGNHPMKSNCDCECPACPQPSYRVPDPSDPVCGTCQCPAGQSFVTSGGAPRCECSTSCSSPKFHQPGDCTNCVCPKCPQAGAIQDPETCECRCSISCGALGVSPNKCACNCSADEHTCVDSNGNGFCTRLPCPE